MNYYEEVRILVTIDELGGGMPRIGFRGKFVEEVAVERLLENADWSSLQESNLVIRKLGRNKLWSVRLSVRGLLIAARRIGWTFAKS